MDLKNKWLVGILRSLAGLLLVVFGLNGFLSFLPMPEMTGQAGVLMGALFGTTYMLVMIKGLEIIIGLMLLTNWQTPLALILLAPLTVNFVLFHLVFAPAGVVNGLFLMIVNIYLAWVHWDNFKGIFSK